MSQEHPEARRPAEERAQEEARRVVQEAAAAATEAAPEARAAAASEAAEAAEAAESTEAAEAAAATEAARATRAADVAATTDTTRAAAAAGPGNAPGLPELDVEELRDRWQRAVAENENLRKRHDRQLADARGAERDRVTAAWLPVVDHLELALQHAAADPRAIVAGVEAVCQQAFAVLAQLGYQRIAEVGEPFDPRLHEAAQVREDPAAAPGSVVQVLRAGYGSDRGLLRPAVVSVAARPEAAGSQE
ncbi:nucleotide exchange factor GrpE [Streptomyces sp. NPDC126499]|uniref:nucleotide exchange factor GrpE n=1 Tax=Streptomyces sp. NPDC126499 TaxID=3155314 RepID=UPI00333023BA